MKLTLDMRLRPKAEAELRLQLCGGATDSLFPRVEAVLISDPEAQEALFFVTGKKKVENYESLMDFVFCETFREYRPACLKYYGGGGPPLRETLAELPQWRFCERVMLAALDFAKTAHRQKRRVDWCWFIGTLKKAVKERGD